MKVAVIGSRTLDVNIAKFIPKEATLIVSGGAKGIDTLAEDYAAARGIPTHIILPNYQKYGRVAPLIRNRFIVQSADMVIAIWDGMSKGTKYTIDYAEELGIPIRIYRMIKSAPAPKKEQP